MYETLETPFLRGGCEPDVDPVPSDDGVQTYGTGAFGTLWVAPHEYDTQWWGPNAEEGYSMKPVGANADYAWVEEDYEKGIYYDIPEEKLDLDQFFHRRGRRAGRLVRGVAPRRREAADRGAAQGPHAGRRRRPRRRDLMRRLDISRRLGWQAFPHPPTPGTKTLLLSSTFIALLRARPPSHPAATGSA